VQGSTRSTAKRLGLARRRRARTLDGRAGIRQVGPARGRGGPGSLVARGERARQSPALAGHAGEDRGEEPMHRLGVLRFIELVLHDAADPVEIPGVERVEELGALSL
jgi:hypothetical protein